MNAVTGAIDQHGAGPVKYIPGGDQVSSRLQSVLGSTATVFINAAINSKYGKINVDVHIDVGGAIERIEDEHITTLFVFLRYEEGLFLFGKP